jgi:hypothetical protein
MKEKVIQSGELFKLIKLKASIYKFNITPTRFAKPSISQA